jgi:uncharacterized membrane protein
MSTWLLITLCVFVLGGITFLVGEWLSHHLVSSRMPRWIRREERRSDPLAANSDGREQD